MSAASVLAYFFGIGKDNTRKVQIKADQQAQNGSRRMKAVPTLYEADSSKYAGPHNWQTQWWAKLVRQVWHQRAYTRWVQAACKEVQVTGLENLDQLQGPCVLVANHTSHLDTLVMQEVLPSRWRRRVFYGAAQDRWFVKGRKGTTVQPWYQSLVLGNFPILRGGGKSALNYAKTLLRQGESVFLFPEGTRAAHGNLGQFKHGATLLAMQLGVPVVPVYLEGLEKIRPKGQRKAKPGRVAVHILEPVRFEREAEVEACTATLAQMLGREHARYTASQLEGDAANDENGARRDGKTVASGST